METFATVLLTSITTVALLPVFYFAFLFKIPEKKKKWKQCSACKKWQEAK